MSLRLYLSLFSKVEYKKSFINAPFTYPYYACIMGIGVMFNIEHNHEKSLRGASVIMKVAIIGSRSIKNIDISSYIPRNITEVISGGAIGIDSLAEAYADKMNIPKQIIKPEYDEYGKVAPLKRNKIIADKSDVIVAIWDGKSRGTRHVIDYAHKTGKSVKVNIIYQT